MNMDMNMDMNMTKNNNFLTVIIILLLGVLIYLFFFKEEGIFSKSNTEDAENEDLPIQEEDLYTVSVGNPKLITRCKPLPPVNKVEKIDFGLKPAYTPNSRGNVCEKGKIDDNVLFPALSNENVLENITSDGETILPVSSYTGDEAPFSANCSFTKPDCSNQQTTLFPGEILVKESIPVGSNEAPVDTVESFDNYYEGFESSQCGSYKKEEYDRYEGFTHDPDEKTVELIFYGAEWCGHCKTAKPGWNDFVDKHNGKQIKGHKLTARYEECGEGENKKCEISGIKGFPTFKCRINGGNEKEINVSDRSKKGFLNALESEL